MQWLLDCGFIYRVKQVCKPSIPLAGYETNSFKIFLHDVGLLAAKADVDADTLLGGNRIFGEFKGSLTEQYVLQEMVFHGVKPFYWASNGRI